RVGRKLRSAAWLHRHGYTGMATPASCPLHTPWSTGSAAMASGLPPHVGVRRGPQRWRPRHRARCRGRPRLLIGLFSLRVRAIFFAMVTLAVASAFPILADT